MWIPVSCPSGDEVITQGRRIHDPELFIESLTKRCIDINKEIMSRYIDYLSIHPWRQQGLLVVVWNDSYYELSLGV